MNTTHNTQTFSHMDHKMILILLLYALIPTCYTTTRIHFLGDYDSPHEINIAAHIQFLGIFYEVLQEALIAPLFFVIQGIKYDQSDLKGRMGSIFVIICAVYGLAFLLVSYFAPSLVVSLQQKADLLQATIDYIRLESFNFLLAILVQFLVVIAMIKNDYHILLLCILLRLSVALLCDTLFLSILKIGVNGIAYSNLVMNACVIALFAFKYQGKYHLTFCWDISWYKSAFKGCFLSGLESFVRNACFFYMILLMLNKIEQQDLFWLSLSFLWSWLLLPILQFGEYVKKDVSCDVRRAKTNFLFYMLCVTFVIIVWLVSIPYYEWFLSVILNIQSSKQVLEIVLQSLAFYIIFAYGSIITNIFYGIGTIHLILYQSLWVNVVVYGSVFLLYQVNIYVPTLQNIVFLMGGGMALGAIINAILYYMYIYRQTITP